MFMKDEKYLEEEEEEEEEEEGKEEVEKRLYNHTSPLLEEEFPLLFHHVCSVDLLRLQR